MLARATVDAARTDAIRSGDVSVTRGGPVSVVTPTSTSVARPTCAVTSTKFARILLVHIRAPVELDTPIRMEFALVSMETYFSHIVKIISLLKETQLII